MSALRRYPGILAWLGLIAYVLAADVWLSMRGKPTMSRTLGHYLRNPLLGPLLAGIVKGTEWHLTTEEPFQFEIET